MSVYPQFATDFEVQRIVTDRLEYLYWVQRHFADQVLPPHGGRGRRRPARPGPLSAARRGRRGGRPPARRRPVA